MLLFKYFKNGLDVRNHRWSEMQPLCFWYAASVCVCVCVCVYVCVCVCVCVCEYQYVICIQLLVAWSFLTMFSFIVCPEVCKTKCVECRSFPCSFFLLLKHGTADVNVYILRYLLIVILFSFF